jgi:hypothetical protein
MKATYIAAVADQNYKMLFINPEVLGVRFQKISDLNKLKVIIIAGIQS